MMPQNSANTDTGNPLLLPIVVHAAALRVMTLALNFASMAALATRSMPGVSLRPMAECGRTVPRR
jgi:hypothetical protein